MFRWKYKIKKTNIWQKTDSSVVLLVFFHFPQCNENQCRILWLFLFVQVWKRLRIVGYKIRLVLMRNWWLHCFNVYTRCFRHFMKNITIRIKWRLIVFFFFFDFDILVLIWCVPFFVCNQLFHQKSRFY